MRNFNARLVAVPLVVSAVALFALKAPCKEPVSPSRLGMSADRLLRITAEAEHQVEKGNLVGMVSLVARRGEIVYLEAVGHQNREKDVPMKRDTIFRVASFSKPVTSLAILMLYEEGRIQLTDPLSKYVPEFSEMQVVHPDGKLEDAHREITIYDLLTHNSGLAYHDHSVVGHYYHKADITCGLDADDDRIGEDVRDLARIPLAQHPGSGFLYGLNSDVLGYVVEVVSEQTFADFLKHRFFAPLSMKDTKFFLDEEDVSRLAQLYVRGKDGLLQPENIQERIVAGYPLGSRRPFEGAKVSYSGGGGLCSTCEDYFRFCQMVLQKGECAGNRILSRKTIEQATLPHLAISEGFFCADSSDFGLGFAVQRGTGTRRPGSPGTLRWGSIFNGFFFIDPEEELIGITIGQLFPGEGEWAEKFMQLAYGAVDD